MFIIAGRGYPPIADSSALKKFQVFIEPNRGKEGKGWIEVICGSMFSGKTEELIRRMKRAQIANQTVEIFKPAIDVRYDDVMVVSHDANAIRSTPVTHSENILLLAPDTQVVGIDEAQFLDAELPAVCEKLAIRGARVIIAGLDMDFEGKPFGPMPHLLGIADYITKVHAICVKCGEVAHFSYRKTADTAKILLGEKESYEPRCRSCYYKGADA
ncbi:MAG: thymidine kinase [Chitinophagales bacterium]